MISFLFKSFIVLCLMGAYTAQGQKVFVPPQRAITIDGDMSDWTNEAACRIYTGAGSYIQSVYIAQDDTHLFVRYDLARPMTNATFGYVPRYFYTLANHATNVLDLSVGIKDNNEKAMWWYRPDGGTNLPPAPNPASDLGISVNRTNFEYRVQKNYDSDYTPALNWFAGDPMYAWMYDAAVTDAYDYVELAQLATNRPVVFQYKQFKTTTNLYVEYDVVVSPEVAGVVVKSPSGASTTLSNDNPGSSFWWEYENNNAEESSFPTGTYAVVISDLDGTKHTNTYNCSIAYPAAMPQIISPTNGAVIESSDKSVEWNQVTASTNNIYAEIQQVHSNGDTQDIEEWQGKTPTSSLTWSKNLQDGKNYVVKLYFYNEMNTGDGSTVMDEGHTEESSFVRAYLTQSWISTKPDKGIIAALMLLLFSE